MPKTAPPRYAHLLDKDPTDLHMRFADWISEYTGLDRDEIDEKSVQLAVALRMDFQRSDENQAVLSERKEAAAKRLLDREAKQLEREAKKAEKAKKAADKAESEPDEELEDDEDGEETEEAPKANTRRRGAKKPTAKAAVKPTAKAAPPASKGRRAKKAAAKPPVDDDFDADDDI